MGYIPVGRRIVSAAPPLWQSALTGELLFAAQSASRSEHCPSIVIESAVVVTGMSVACAAAGSTIGAQTSASTTRRQHGQTITTPHRGGSAQRRRCGAP